MAQFRTSYGGAKPPMISGFDVFMRSEHQRKPGFYRLSHDWRLLARLVELRERGEAVLASLPSRASLLEAMQSPDFQAPPVDNAGGKGHIRWNPTPEMPWHGPSVGVDADILDRVARDERFLWIEFVVYTARYREVDRWHIHLDDFDAQCAEVAATGFTLQYQVPVSALRPGRAPRASH